MTVEKKLKGGYRLIVRGKGHREIGGQNSRGGRKGETKKGGEKKSAPKVLLRRRGVR